MGLSTKKIEALRRAFDEGMSIRDSAAAVGVSKCTVTRWWRKWRYADGGREIRCVLESGVKERFDREAVSRGMNSSALLQLVLTEIVEDDLFDAVIDRYREAVVDHEQVARLIASGLTERCVAERMGISIWQVKRSKKRST